MQPIDLTATDDRRTGAPAPHASTAPASMEKSHRHPLGWFFFFLGLTLVILAGGFVAWMLVIKPAQSLGTTLKTVAEDALRKITGQQVAVHASTVTVEKSNIAELATVSRRTQTIIKYQTKMLGSEKTLILRGDFVVKAGFDLTKPYKIDFDDQTGEVRADFPPAKILSVELKELEPYYSSDGLINKLNAEDQTLATQKMLVEARLQAEKSDIKQEAEAQLQVRLKDLLGQQAKRIWLRGDEVRP